MRLVKEEIVREGSQVYCDICDADADVKDENGNLPKGGALMGSYAICPECFARHQAQPDYSDDIDEYHEFDKTKPFGDNVREYRRTTYGTDELIITFYTME